MAFSLPQFQRHLALAGFEVRDVPFVERADIFSTKGGDRVIEHLLTLNYGNTEYALRPEFTAPAARAFGLDGRPVVRWQFSGPVFEDRIGNGEFAFQRMSAGAELLGLSGPLADSEVIGLAASGLENQGITGFQVVIGHAGLTRKLVERFTPDPQVIQFLLNQRAALSDESQGRTKVERQLESFLNLHETAGRRELMQDGEQLSELLAGLSLRTSTLGGRTREDIARRLVNKQRRTVEISQMKRAVDALETWIALKGPPSAILPQIYQLAEDSPDFAATAAELRTTLSLLEGYGVETESVVLQPDLNRIWEYYSGVVFELQTMEGVSLGGGGRYDGLLRLLGSAVDAPAVGFQINADAVWKIAGRPQDFPAAIHLAGTRTHALSLTHWANALRALGIACAVYEAPADTLPDPVVIEADGAHFRERVFPPGQASELVTYIQEISRI